MNQPLSSINITLLSPYHSGSHAAWAEGFSRASQHKISLRPLPGRFWRWRMHGGAVTLARQFLEQIEKCDLILATDMLDLSTFLALTRRQTAQTPTALYMHENQLTYPLLATKRSESGNPQSTAEERHFAFINFSSMLAADTIYFNSEYHRSVWFEHLPRLLNHYPDFRELESIDLLQAKSMILPVGIDLQRLAAPTLPTPNQVPLITWNQRWEYDKNPAGFFKVLYALDEKNVAFNIALCGENFRQHAAEFEEAIAHFGPRVIHAGFASAETYRTLLQQTDFVISTAIHEFFGISMLEAAYCGCTLFLPNRLSYPELIPSEYHQQVLYSNENALIERLAVACQNWVQKERSSLLADAARQYDWSMIAPIYDNEFYKLASK